MSRLTVECEMGHTCLFPGKDDTRTDMVCRIPSGKDLITISHGILNVLNIRRFNGRILVVDKDPGVIESTHYMRVGDPGNGKPSDFPKLKLLPEFLGDAADGVRWYAERYGLRHLGGIDLDLTGTANKVVPPVERVLTVLRDYSYSKSVPVFVTYSNGRDEVRGAANRVSALTARLGTYCIWHRCYRSDWIGRYATREQGASMAIVGMKLL